MSINHEKCIFKATEITFLGQRWNQIGYKISRKSKENLTPRDRKELSSFLEMVNYHSKYVNDFAELVTSLTELRSGHVAFCWGSRQQHSFETLKSCSVGYPAIQAFDPKEEAVLSPPTQVKHLFLRFYPKRDIHSCICLGG